MKIVIRDNKMNLNSTYGNYVKYDLVFDKTEKLPESLGALLDSVITLKSGVKKITNLPKKRVLGINTASEIAASLRDTYKNHYGININDVEIKVKNT